MEERTRKTGYAALLALSGLFAAAAAATLIPNPGASWPNVLGYRSLCTFAPIATAVCALLAGATCTLRARLFGASSGRGRPWFAPLGAALVLVAVIGFSLPAYLAAKSGAAVEATSGATREAGAGE